MLPTIMSRGAIDLCTRTPRFIAPFSASAPSHHNLSSVDFITNIAESNFWYTQGQGRNPRDRRQRGDVLSVASGVQGPLASLSATPDLWELNAADWSERFCSDSARSMRVQYFFLKPKERP